MDCPRLKGWHPLEVTLRRRPVFTADSEEGVPETYYKQWQNVMEAKGLRMNAGKIKMI